MKVLKYWKKCGKIVMLIVIILFFRLIYRQLSKIPKTPINIIDNMHKLLGDFQHIIRASIEELDDVEGIGEVRARTIKQTLKKMQEQFAFDNILI